MPTCRAPSNTCRTVGTSFVRISSGMRPTITLCMSRQSSAVLAWFRFRSATVHTPSNALGFALYREEAGRVPAQHFGLRRLREAVALDDGLDGILGHGRVPVGRVRRELQVVVAQQV